MPSASESSGAATANDAGRRSTCSRDVTPSTAEILIEELGALCGEEQLVSCTASVSVEHSVVGVEFGPGISFGPSVSSNSMSAFFISALTIPYLCLVQVVDDTDALLCSDSRWNFELGMSIGSPLCVRSRLRFSGLEFLCRACPNSGLRGVMSRCTWSAEP